MSLGSSMTNLESPHFYSELGRLISSTGDDHFATKMLQLVDKLVPVSLVELSEWTLDEHQASVLDIKPLGYASHTPDCPPAPMLHHPDNHLLLEKMIEMDDSLLIHMNARSSGPGTVEMDHQCNLVSRTDNRRWVISLCRPPNRPVFSLTEMSFLKNLSDTLLPLTERHARISRQEAAKALRNSPTGTAGELERKPLEQAFEERLALEEIVLSAREREVCLGLLSGCTVPRLAEQLSVKNSSIETYLKRAASKLGVSGRHGLIRWMAGA
ncbi:transcriptional regulator, LuxR family [Pseudomonas asplenii]|uniref:Transcriptional regulator, LuxR family n=1 Tax=Pseudomonas asplenii TaxID=53407 RepID=A0A1H1XIL3_9PSED|nr:helix-turn-helix transcriptional regulator [Pseudomonas asplenii]SDT09134.1 transcriptional regulator, LuxR family [Pseudomonas asplenii]